MKNPTKQNRKSVFWVGLILFLINIFFWLLAIFGALYSQNNWSNLFFIPGIFVTLISLILWGFGSIITTAIKESRETLANNGYNLKSTYLQNRNEILLGISIALFIVSVRLAFIPQIVDHKAGSIEWYLQIALMMSAMLTFLAGMYLGIPILYSVLVSHDEASRANELRKEREKAEKTTNELFLHLKKIGLDVTVESKELKKLDRLNSILCSIRVENKNIDLIELQLHLEEWDSEYSSGVKEYYYCNYMIHIKMENLVKEKMWATSTPIYRHFFSRQIVGIIWRGTELAQSLNKDVNLTALLISQPKIAKVQITPMDQLINIKQDRYSSLYDAFPTYATFEAYDIIARHIQSITGLS